MSKWLKKMLKYLLFLLLLIIVVLAGLIIYAQINNYSPSQAKFIKDPSSSPDINYDRQTFTFLSWNIGYCSLGDEMDFFYADGERVKPALEEFKIYSKGIYNTLSDFPSTDFIFLQEVDVNSRRSYFINEKNQISRLFPNHESHFAVNYDVEFVPLPVTKPLGKVKSGIQMLSKLPSHGVLRHYYESSYSWPYNLFMPNRVYIKSKYHLHKDGNLIVYNTHNSAFDSEGKLRKKEFETIRNDMVDEFLRGNYVVAGGDWNQNPPDFNPSYDSLNYNLSPVKPGIGEEKLLSKWKWVWKRGIPTNRSNNRPFEKGKNQTTIIDYYIISPNLSVDTVYTIDQQFRYSDHHPVFMKVSIPDTNNSKNPAVDKL